MFTLLIAFTAAYIQVLLKSFQQLNVVYHKILWVMPVSLALAASEAFVVFALYSAIVEKSISLVLAVGLGGGLGAVTGMILHKRIR